MLYGRTNRDNSAYRWSRQPLGSTESKSHSKSLPCLSDTEGRHTPTSFIWVKWPEEVNSEMYPFCPGRREGKKRKRFRLWWEIPLGRSVTGGAQGSQQLFPASGIWCREQPHVIDKAPELTLQHLCSTSRFLPAGCVTLGKLLTVLLTDWEDGSQRSSQHPKERWYRKVRNTVDVRFSM